MIYKLNIRTVSGNTFSAKVDPETFAPQASKLTHPIGSLGLGVVYVKALWYAISKIYNHKVPLTKENLIMLSTMAAIADNESGAHSCVREPMCYSALETVWNWCIQTCKYHLNTSLKNDSSSAYEWEIDAVKFRGGFDCQLTGFVNYKNFLAPALRSYLRTYKRMSSGQEYRFAFKMSSIATSKGVRSLTESQVTGLTSNATLSLWVAAYFWCACSENSTFGHGDKETIGMKIVKGSITKDNVQKYAEQLLDYEGYGYKVKTLDSGNISVPSIGMQLDKALLIALAAKQTFMNLGDISVAVSFADPSESDLVSRGDEMLIDSNWQAAAGVSHITFKRWGSLTPVPDPDDLKSEAKPD